ncbi:MAG TPA: dihydrofolate reductase family protein [Chloroflexota bacterium]|nr:dihydrofolate reductase family protein [Chloroflexota bacterium]
MTRRPYVLINVAATLDGKIDTVERRGATISSERDRHRVDLLRASADAVMVGGRTLRDEDPRLLVRSADLRAERRSRGLPENPAKVAVVSTLRLKPDARFLTAGPARIIVFTPTGDQAHAAALPRQLGVEVYAFGAGRVDLKAALATLADLGIQRVLVEGGGSLNFELLRGRLVDEVHVFVAPLIFGGASAPTLADGAGLTRDLALPLSRADVETWDDGGIVLRYKVDPRE